MPPYISDPVCHLIFLTFFIHTVPLGRCALLTPHCWQFLLSVETFDKRSFSVFGPTVWNSLPLSLRKTQCFTTFKTKHKTHLFRTHLCWSASVSFCVYCSGGVCVCVSIIISLCILCVCVCLLVLRVFFSLIGCFSMTVWTPTAFGCLTWMRFLFSYLHLFSATEHVSHGKAL